MIFVRVLTIVNIKTKMNKHYSEILIEIKEKSKDLSNKMDKMDEHINKIKIKINEQSNKTKKNK